ncbi:MAG TPA: oligosaccharide flippase family protein [Anaerolineales bacterium]|nr:oligosaccharide flippase family protein [Anaerolineales bacterium]
MGSGLTGGEVSQPSSRWRGRRQLALRLLSGDVALKGYLSGLDQALISLTNFATTILLARALSPTQFGAYGVGFILTRLARAFQEGLVVQPMTSMAPSMEESPRRAYLTASGGHQVVLAAVGALGCVIVGGILTSLGNNVAGPTLFALWCPILLAQPQEFLRRVFYTLNRVNLAVLSTLVSGVSQLAFLAWALRAGADSGTVGLYAIGWSSGVALFLGLIQTRRLWTLQGIDLLATWRRNWSFGRWMLGGTAANWIAIEVYPILTAGLINFAATGAYRALQNVVAPIHSLLRAVDTYFTPRLADRRRVAGPAGVVHMLRRMFLVTGLPVAAVLIAALVFTEPLLQVLYGSTYQQYAGGMRLMVVFYALLYSYWPLQSALKALQRPRAIFIANMVALFSMATIGIWAILRWGVYGTIAGQALNAGIISILLWAAWRRWTISSRASPDATLGLA